MAVGFSCRIYLNIETKGFNEGAVLVPISAIVASDTDNTKYVFVYNKQTQKVERRQIMADELLGKNSVVITSGLQVGDQVVSAGATRMEDGQQVKVLTD